MTVFLLCIAVFWGVLMSMSPASAHGVGPGTQVAGVSWEGLLLIVIMNAVLFTLFLVFTQVKKGWTVLVTGGGGYVGSALVPKLLKRGHKVTVLDIYLRGDDVLESVHGYAKLREVKGDIRDPRAVEYALKGCDAVIHLANISPGTSYDPDPGLGKLVNYDAFRPFVRAAKKAGIKRFIYASSFSVYGVKDGSEITEESPLEPLTEYSKHKALCEQILEEEREPGFITCTVRPAIVCGYAPGQRLDLIANNLTHDAVDKGRIKVLGGSQKRPHIHIDDMTGLYLHLLDQADARIDGKAFNAVSENLTLLELAVIVQTVVGDGPPIKIEPTDDLDSYNVSSDRLRRELEFKPSHTIEEAVSNLAAAFRDGKILEPVDNPKPVNTETAHQ